MLIFLGVPIGIAMIFVAMGYYYATGMGLLFAVQQMVDGLNSFPLLAIPLFILAASLMNATSITKHLFGFAQSLVGHIRGGWATSTFSPASSSPACPGRPWPMPVVSASSRSRPCGTPATTMIFPAR